VRLCAKPYKCDREKRRGRRKKSVGAGCDAVMSACESQRAQSEKEVMLIYVGVKYRNEMQTKENGERGRCEPCRAETVNGAGLRTQNPEANADATRRCEVSANRKINRSDPDKRKRTMRDMQNDKREVQRVQSLCVTRQNARERRAPR